MNELCQVIKDMVKSNFLNIRTSIQTYDRDALCCGAPCWRWVYHALHSADKWFINPCVYEEPPFHEKGMDNPDNPTSVVLSDEELLAYLDEIEKKTYDYIVTPLQMKCFMNVLKNASVREWSLYYAKFAIFRSTRECLMDRPLLQPGNFPCGYRRSISMLMTVFSLADTERDRFSHKDLTIGVNSSLSG